MYEFPSEDGVMELFVSFEIRWWKDGKIFENAAGVIERFGVILIVWQPQQSCVRIAIQSLVLGKD